MVRVSSEDDLSQGDRYALPVLVTELANRTGNIGVSTGQLYYINTLGAAVGALVAAYALLPLGGLDGAVAIAAAINMGIVLRTDRKKAES